MKKKTSQETIDTFYYLKLCYIFCDFYRYWHKYAIGGS